MVSSRYRWNTMWISLFNIMTITRSAGIVTFSLVINSLHSLSTAQNDYGMVSHLRSTYICSFIDQLLGQLASAITLHLVSAIAMMHRGWGVQFPQAPLCKGNWPPVSMAYTWDFPLAIRGVGGKKCPRSRRVVSPTQKFQILNGKYFYQAAQT